MADITMRFHKDMIVLDGAMGTLLADDNLAGGLPPMLLNAMEPDLIKDVHGRYLRAGAQVLTTNSFEGTRPQLVLADIEDQFEELNRLSVALAKECRPEHVLADIGPCGLMLAPFGDTSEDELFEVYAEQARVLAAEGPDGIIIESMIDLNEALCALKAALSVTDLPVFITVSFDKYGHMDFTGTSPAEAAQALGAAGASVVGVNCGLELEPQADYLKEMAAATDLPLLIQPNAGLLVLDDRGQAAYDRAPDDMAKAAWEYRELGAQFIGSCCGSTPAFTAAIYGTIGGLDVNYAGRAHAGGN